MPNLETLALLAFGGDRVRFAAMIEGGEESKLRTLVLGAPDVLDYSARSRGSSREEEEGGEEEEENLVAIPKPVSSLDSPTSSFWTTTEEEVVSLLQNLLRDVDSLAVAETTLPAMKEVLVWGLDFESVRERRSRSLKVVCEEMRRQLGWVVKDRFGERRDASWEVEEVEEEAGEIDSLSVIDGSE